jgi:CubicO group peptidase (beta-lactamase class C family)
MKKGFVLGVILALSLGAGWLKRPVEEGVALARAGAAYKAKLLCSATLGAGRDATAVLQGELGGADFAMVDTNLAPPRAQGHALVFTREALFRPGLGCTLVPAVGDSLPSGFKAPAIAPKPWPGGDLREAAIPGLKRPALEAALEEAFREPTPERPRQTRAIVVLWRGGLLTERYAPGFDAQTPLLGWSMSKSLTNALVGMRVRDGALRLDGPVPLVGWAGDERREITLDHLLRMSSGLAFTEHYDDFTSDVVSMLFGPAAVDTGGFAARQPLAFAPDSHWSYASGTTNIIQKVLRESFPSTEAYWRYLFDRLYAPLGMTHSFLEPDAAGTFVGSSFGYGSARDWARFGQLFLDDGIWAGQRLLPEGWVDYSTTPTPKAPYGSYGAHWWLNVGEPDDPTARPFQSLPQDLYRASGFEGQNVIIVPSRDLVVVRLGYTPDERLAGIEALVRGILDALPPD